MLTPGNVQVWVATEPVSLLKSIDGLAAEVERRFAEDPSRAVDARQEPLGSGRGRGTVSR